MKRILVIALGIGVIAAYLLTIEAPSSSQRGHRTKVTSSVKSDSGVAAFASLGSLFTLPENLQAKIKHGLKVLLNSKEQDTVNDALADRVRIEDAKNALLKYEATFNRQSESLRLKAVEFLAASLFYEDNPSRDYLLSAVTEILSSDNVFRITNLEHRKSLAGDKVELFDALLQTQPTLAMEIFDKSRGTDSFKIFRFAKGHSEFKNRTN